MKIKVLKRTGTIFDFERYNNSVPLLYCIDGQKIRITQPYHRVSLIDSELRNLKEIQTTENIEFENIRELEKFVWRSS